MKRIALFIAALMILSFGLANAQDAITVSFSNTYVEGATTYLKPGPTTISFTSVITTAPVKGGTNGFEIYVLGGGGFTAVDGAFPAQAGWDGGTFVNKNSCDGAGMDSIGFGGFAIMGAGLPVGTNVFYTATTGFTDGQTACIDTAFYPPGGAWLWSTDGGDVIPDWYDQAFCIPVKTQPDPPATFDNCPTVVLTKNHCDLATYDFNATDAGTNAGPVVFGMVSGDGAIDANTGVWSYAPTLADVNGPKDVVVKVTDQGGNVTECHFQVQYTNLPPTIACQDLKVIGAGKTITVAIAGTNVDCDPGTYSIVGVTPAPAGTYGIDPNTGVLTFATALADKDLTFTFTVQYSDGKLGATCDQQIKALGVEPFGIYIEKTHLTFQGGHEYVDVNMFKGSEEMWGFDILIAYDASALSFQTAIPGQLYDLCGWEYFTYRYGANGNCGNGCPSGLLRVVGIAETNNGANHPDCKMPAIAEFTMFTLDFLVTDNRTYECQYVPIRFFWMDCGDNSISYHERADQENPYSQKLAISNHAFDYAFGSDGSFMPEEGRLIPLGQAFPGYGGAIAACETEMKDVPVRLIDFYNGGIDIACADSIDARGDINLNGTAYEIADAVLYSNYFVFGIGVFDYYQAQVAASDVNADGIPLSVADLVYLIRVVVGDALPYPKVAPVAAAVTYDGSIISVNENMGAAYVVVEGQVTPSLLISGVEMKYAYDATENVTRVLVVGMEKDAVINGSFLNAGGTIVSVELATYEGAPVSAKLIPASFALNQNYPNPFNPSTTISFALPTASEYTITVYNVTGQVVSTINGQSEAGMVSVEFNASDLSSGIYFYNVEAGSFSATKKMVLIK